MKKNFKKFISVFLSVVMAITVIPATTYAMEEFENDYEFSPDEVSIEYEIESKRTENSKTYMTDNGGYYQVSAAVPIHKEVNGEWEEISEIDNNIETIADAENTINEIATYSVSNPTETGFYESETLTLYSNGADINPMKIAGTNKTENGINSCIYVKPSIITDKQVFINNAKESAEENANIDYSMSYEYNLDNVGKVIFGNGASIVYEYDGSNIVKTIYDNGKSGDEKETYVYSYKYNSDGSVAEMKDEVSNTITAYTKRGCTVKKNGTTVYSNTGSKINLFGTSFDYSQKSTLSKDKTKTTVEDSYTVSLIKGPIVKAETVLDTFDRTISTSVENKGNTDKNTHYKLTSNTEYVPQLVNSTNNLIKENRSTAKYYGEISTGLDTLSLGLRTTLDADAKSYWDETLNKQKDVVGSGYGLNYIESAINKNTSSVTKYSVDEENTPYKVSKSVE